MAFKTDCLIIDIALGSAAFEDRGAELARILKRLAAGFERGEGLLVKSDGELHLFDANGNCCGHLKLVERRER